MQYVCICWWQNWCMYCKFSLVYWCKTNYALGLYTIISLSNVTGETLERWRKCIPASTTQILYRHKTHVNGRCKCHSYLFKETWKTVNNKHGLVKTSSVKQLPLKYIWILTNRLIVYTVCSGVQSLSTRRCHWVHRLSVSSFFFSSAFVWKFRQPETTTSTLDEVWHCQW